MDLKAYEVEQRRHHRWNSGVLLLDTASFAMLSKILNPNVTLSYYLSYFTTSRLAVGLIPAILMLGGMFSQLFWANATARLQRKKPVFVLGTIVSRGSMLLFLASAALAGRSGGVAPVAMFYLALLVYSLSNGLLGPLWANYVAKVFPDGRGRFLGLAYFAEALASLSAAAGMRWVLDHYAFPLGFVQFFALLAGLGVLSMLPAMLFREVPYPVPEPALPLADALREVPTILRQYPSYTRYLVARIVVCFAEMAGQFFTLYAVTQLAAGPAQVATYTMLFVGGGLVANLLWGAVGDRIGFIRVFQITFGVGAGLLALVLTARTPVALYPAFLLQGIYSQGIILAVNNLNMATSPPERTPTFVALANAITGPFLTLTPLLGAVIATAFGYRALFLACLVIYVVDVGIASWAARGAATVEAASLPTPAASAPPGAVSPPAPDVAD